MAEYKAAMECVAGAIDESLDGKILVQYLDEKGSISSSIIGTTFLELSEHGLLSYSDKIFEPGNSLIPLYKKAGDNVGDEGLDENARSESGVGRTRRKPDHVYRIRLVKIDGKEDSQEFSERVTALVGVLLGDSSICNLYLERIV